MWCLLVHHVHWSKVKLAKLEIWILHVWNYPTSGVWSSEPPKYLENELLHNAAIFGVQYEVKLPSCLVRLIYLHVKTQHIDAGLQTWSIWEDSIFYKEIHWYLETVSRFCRKYEARKTDWIFLHIYSHAICLLSFWTSLVIIWVYLCWGGYSLLFFV